MGVKNKKYWLDMLERDKQAAEQMLLHSGSIKPLFALHTDTALMLITGEWTDDDSHERLLQVVRIAAVAYNVTSISTLTEGWMWSVDLRPGESIKSARKRANGRVEVLTINLEWRDDEDRGSLVSVCNILRDKEGKIIGLGEETEDNKDTEVLGKMVDLLPPEDVPEDVQVIAQDMLKSLGVECAIVPVHIHPAGHA
jgi:hypothetical protein